MVNERGMGRACGRGRALQAYLVDVSINVEHWGGGHSLSSLSYILHIHGGLHRGRREEESVGEGWKGLTFVSPIPIPKQKILSSWFRACPADHLSAPGLTSHSPVSSAFA